jgi:hypothetical protein
MTRTVLAGILIGLGLSLLLGSDARTSAPQFVVARDLMPIDAWGTAAVVLGGLLLAAETLTEQLRIPTRLTVVAAAAAAAGWHTFWGTAYIVSAIAEPAASLTGIPVHLGLALLALLVAVREG